MKCLCFFCTPDSLWFHSGYEVRKTGEVYDKCLHADILYGHMPF